jgi:protein phosphatase 1 regulatory subunit 7
LKKVWDLDFGSNRISLIENLDHMKENLTRLSLAKNSIRKIENLNNLTNLTFLTLQSNRLTKIEGLTILVNLKQLHLSQNFIEKIEGIETLKELEILDLAYNKIETLENLENNSQLVDLWLNHNKIKNFSDLDHLKLLPLLTTIYLWRNPVADFPSYRQKIVECCPKMEQIDQTFIN